MTDIFQSIFLGIIQGASEFLPISSSGHLILIPKIFGWKDQGLAFDVALHWGTLFAVIAYFWNDWKNIIQNIHAPSTVKNMANGVSYPLKIISRIRNSTDLLLIIIMATLPGILSGILLNDYAENYFRSPFLIACTLFIGALLLAYSDRKGAKGLKISDITMKTGLLIGIAQALAIIPGISRSGITITAALFLGLDRASAARFSFLLSTPVILGAGIKELPSLIKQGIGMDFIAGIAFAFLSGYLAIKYMIKYLNTNNYDIFVAYRIILAIFILIYFFNNL